ncbi:CsbD family protein [Compostimonas suwonensis]|uniref:CsbD-like protein n=1 Tax=Compostimonas suwonensis TaxID=1048394 RepID=A0A2M9C0D9_9MICO|nr:CsbD family protein [Compostimonas suwonensis]PJJ63803.1 CsbD-like protein [Compostimonas suwonensis]
MSAEDKIKAATDKVVGKAKEAAGHVANNDKLVAEGKADQTKGNIRDAAENVKDAFTK